MREFTHVSRPARVVFGPGALLRLGEEIDRLGCRSPLVVSTAEQGTDAERLALQLGEHVAGRFARAAMHTPVEVTLEAMDVLTRSAADCIVSFGGGSATGLAKALARRTGLPILAVATTYAGSEATDILGQTEGGAKRTERHLSVLPRTIVYDVNLTLDLPARMSVASGLNALAHAAEALYAADRSPIVEIMAQESAAALARSLPAIVANPRDPNARADALYGAWLAGTCLCAAEMGLHHQLCHVLGGTFGLPHADTHAVVLPYAVAFNARAAPDAMRRLAGALGCSDAVAGLWALARRVDAPGSLLALGLRTVDIPRVTAEVTRNPYRNPARVDPAALAEMLSRALEGAEPMRLPA